MFQYFIKVLISATIIVLATEISKRSSVLAALIIALPLVSLITFCWIYFETKDTLKIANLSYEILYFGLATIPLFLLLPYMLKNGFSFFFSMIMACLSTALTMLLVKVLIFKN
tara:strand:- start:52 stop:390 length:339 start_codon:yes stop_codon:yes gene_type:complete